MSKLSDYLERRVLELFRDAGDVRPDPALRIHLSVRGVRRFAACLKPFQYAELGRNRRRRSSILCKIGLHDWEAWELKLPGLMFVKRCRRRGCKVARAIKPKALGPSSASARSERGGSHG